eukprot:Em0021g69a
MGRNTQRASGLKALQAIKGIQNGKTKQSNVQQSENIVPNGKRASSPGSLAPPNPKRSALGDVTNATGRQGRGKPAKTAAAAKGKQVISVSDPVVQSQESSQTSEDTPITTMNNVLQATKITDDSLRADESLSEDMHNCTRHQLFCRGTAILQRHQPFCRGTSHSAEAPVILQRHQPLPYMHLLTFSGHLLSLLTPSLPSPTYLQNVCWIGNSRGHSSTGHTSSHMGVE